MVVGDFVGRDHELSLLSRALEDGRKRHGSVHLISGEGGIGKTRLTAAVAERARAMGYVTVVGRAFPVETGIPYALFSDGFVPLLREMPPATLQLLTRGALAELGLLFPTLRSEGSPPAPTGGAADLRSRLLDTFAQFLTRLAERQPVLVVLENLHWADPSSIDLFHFVARQVQGHPLMILATYNDAQRDANRGLRVAEQSLASLGVLERHPLRSFTTAETEAMVRAFVGESEEGIEEFVDRVHRRTRGNPFFIGETLKALVLGGRLRQEGGRWVGWTTEHLALPDTIRDALKLRYDGLSENAQRLVQVAAAVGSHVPHSLLARMGKLDAATLVATVEELLRERLLEETDGASGAAYVFTHPMMQEMLYAELSKVRAQALHAAIADALEVEYGSSALQRAEELAVHFRRAASATHGARAIRYLAEAARYALKRGANREAVDLLEAARELAGRTDDPSVRLALLDPLARAKNRLGEYTAASKLWDEAIEVAIGAGETARVAIIERRLGVAAARTGDVVEALAHFGRGLAAAQRAGEPGVEAGLLLARSSVFLDVGRGADAGSDMRQALALAEPLGDQRLLARVHLAMQSLAVWQGPSGDARTHGDRALAYAEASADTHAAWSAHFTHALHAGLTGDPPRMARHLAEAGRLADEMRSPLLRLWNAEMMIEYRSALGEWDEALALADRTIEEARAFGQRLLLPRLLTWAALVQLGRGEFEEGKRLVDEAWLLSGADKVPEGNAVNVHSVVPAHVGLGFYHYYRAEYRAALEIAERGLAIADRTGYTVWAVYRLLPLVAECYMRLYDWEGARAAAKRLREAAEQLGHPLAQAWADACEALEMRFTGDRQASLIRLRAAVEALEAIPYAEHAARLRRRLAEPLIELGDRDGARAELLRAYEAFARLGARLGMDDVRERLREIGFRPPPLPSRRTGLASLTPTELAVARESASGKTNKSAGAALGMSHRTVGTHLQNIYKKLGIHGKVPLIEWLRENEPESR